MCILMNGACIFRGSSGHISYKVCQSVCMSTFFDLIPFLGAYSSKLVDETPMPKVGSFMNLRFNMELHLESLKYKAQYLSMVGTLQELPKERL